MLLYSTYYPLSWSMVNSIVPTNNLPHANYKDQFKGDVLHPPREWSLSPRLRIFIHFTKKFKVGFETECFKLSEKLEQCPDLSYKIMLLNVVSWKMFREVLRTFYLN